MEKANQTAQLPSVPQPDFLLHNPTSQDVPQAFNTALSNAVHSLQHDFTSGARQLASASLRHLSDLTLLAARTMTSQDDLWRMLVHAAERLSRARPSMSAAITSSMLRALARVKQTWGTEKSQSPSFLVENVITTLNHILQERREANTHLAQHFTHWLLDHHSSSPTDDKNPQTPLHILTLSFSSTLLSILTHTLSHLPPTFPALHLTILESRPRCEGADLAARLCSLPSHPSRLRLRIIPDCAVASAARDVDIVLLGADRISSSGAVKNKMGSLAAVVCARYAAAKQSRNVSIVVLSDTDKIAAAVGLKNEEEEEEESHPSSELSAAWSTEARETLEGKEDVEIFGEWFEWVSEGEGDVYVTERGVLGREEVEGVAREVEELEKTIFWREE